jgi:hypothetical protein
MFYELFENFDDNLLDPPGRVQSEGINIHIYDPNGIDIEKILISKETHKSYQKIVEKSGTHKICVSATNGLFRMNPNAKYEMSIQIESLHEHMSGSDQARPDGEKEPNRLVMKEHIDKVD